VQSIAPTSGPMTRVPDDKLMRLFDGFIRVSESDLPKEIDMFHLGVEGMNLIAYSNSGMGSRKKMPRRLKTEIEHWLPRTHSALGRGGVHGAIGATSPFREKSPAG
jgi:hypothetical protein